MSPVRTSIVPMELPRDLILPPAPTTPRSQLTEACKCGDLQRASTTLEGWASTDFRPTAEDLDPALRMAVLFRHTVLVKGILDIGGAPTDHVALTALQDEPDALAILQLLVEHGWPADSVHDTKQYEPLMW